MPGAIAPEGVIPKPVTTMYVGKIPESFDDEFVRRLLEQCGAVRSLQRSRDISTGAPKRFGFCEYDAPDSVEVALSAFKGVAFRGSPDGKEEELVVKCDDKTLKTVHEYIEKCKQAAQRRKLASERQRISTLPPGVPEKTAPIDEARLIKVSDDEFQANFEKRISAARQSIRALAQERSSAGAAPPNAARDMAVGGVEVVSLEGENDEVTEEIKAWRERTAKRDVEAMKKKQSYEDDIKRDAENDERRERTKKLERLKRDLKSYERSTAATASNESLREYEKHYETREHDRIKRWARDKDEEREAHKKRHDRVLSERERKRERETDREDREREERELKRRKEEEAAAERRRAADEERRRKEIEEEKRLTTVKMDLNLGPGSKKSGIAGNAVGGDGDDDEEDDDTFGLKRQEKIREEINKKIMDMVPTGKDELFGFHLDWNVVSRYRIVEEKVRPWVVKKVVEFLGEEESDLISFIVDELKKRPAPEKFLDNLKGALGDDDAAEFVIQVWRLLVFEALSATYNKKINYAN